MIVNLFVGQIGPPGGEITRLREGDVVVLTIPKEAQREATHQTMSEMVAALNKLGIKGVVCAVIEGFSVAGLNEEEMRRHGWVRA